MSYSKNPRERGQGGGPIFAGSPALPYKGSRGIRPPQRAYLMGIALAVLLYSLGVLLLVAWMGDIGVRCIFSNIVREPVSERDYTWKGGTPQLGDSIRAIGPVAVENYSDYIRALRTVSRKIGETIPVTWQDAKTGENRTATVLVRYRPSATYVASVIWFLQEMVIFAIGARVFWKRPGDNSARLFFWLCVLTVGAYMGGYHWTEIVVEPVMIYLFAMFAVFVPVTSLHFYLIFPRINPLLARHKRSVLLALYGIPSVYLATLWGTMLWSRRLSEMGAGSGVEVVLRLVRNLSLGYIGLAVVQFGLCIICLIASFRRAETRAERNQVQWVLLASLIASFLIGYLLVEASFDLSTFGRDSAAWPMFGVSLLYTVAHALSITRYKLMRAEEFINRGVVYVALSVTAGLLYSALLLVSGIIFRDQFLATKQTSRGAMVAVITVVLLLIVSEVARGQFQKAIDRRFYREKYKFDQAMRKMRLAVGSLVDRETLGRRLLEAAAEVLRLEWGAIYLCEEPWGPLKLAACHGPAPEEPTIASENPLVERLRHVPGVKVPHTVAVGGASDPATDAMIALGGEAAAALESDGELAGLLVLGPKRSGMPYEDEELAFLAALSSVATLALHSADIQQTLETLNVELRDKVEKIAEQQRRIMILQDQLTDRAGSRRGELFEAANLQRTELISADNAVFDRIKGSGPAVRQMIEHARKVAASPSAVLIRGESGTGKELLAEAIHAASPRAERPFVKVHCAALSQTLLESELFGHVKGAFTDAHRDRIGRFEQADGGTLFLDEIGDINPEVQTKLLRILQEMSFERVGSSQTIHVDVRILAATHQDLEALIRQGRFREDLYYRLNVIPLRTPPLRERKEDVFELAVTFLADHARRVGKTVTHLDEGAFEALTAHDWPGNIRELENVIERAVVLSDGPAITRADLPEEIRLPEANRSTSRRNLRAPVPATGQRKLATAPATASAKGTGTPTPWAESHGEEPWDNEFLAFERQRLIDALEEGRGNKSEAARLLGIPRSTFCSKLKKHGML